MHGLGEINKIDFFLKKEDSSIRTCWKMKLIKKKTNQKAKKTNKKTQTKNRGKKTKKKFP